MNSIHSQYPVTVFVMFYCLASAWLPLRAQIATDGTVGPALELEGPAYQIPAQLGSQVGNNLFHSFQTFNILTGESATFTGSSSIANVISRVTGGDVSRIDGLLRSRIGTADFYFINPAGVLFGPNAQVDVPAAFHVSTADELQFADGSKYSAVDQTASTLTVAPPEAFGFLGRRTAEIVIDQSQLEFAPDNQVSVTGGELAIRDSGIVIVGGELKLVAVGNVAGVVPVQESPSVDADGPLTIASSLLDVSGDGGGSFLLRAEETIISDSNIFADNDGVQDAVRGIDIIANSLTVLSSFLTTDVLGQGDGGSVAVTTLGSLEILNGGVIGTRTETSGDAGSVIVDAGVLRIDGQEARVAAILSEATGDPNSTGSAGELWVSASETIEIFNGGWIRSDTFTNGKGGTVNIDADALHLNNRGKITSTTHASGDAGLITINTGFLSIDGQGTFTGILSSASGDDPNSTGAAGDVRARASETIEIFNGGSISSDTFAAGNAGNVTIDTISLKINDQGARFPTGIFSNASSNSSGAAGTVQVNATDKIEILNGGAISGDNFSNDNAGEIIVNTTTLRIDGQGTDTSLISSTASGDPSSIGAAGDIRVSAIETLEIFNGGGIVSDTFTAGEAGTVTVDTARLTIDGQGTERLTGITSDANSDSTGDAGNVQVSATKTLEIFNGGEISSDTSAAGDAGTVTINTTRLTIDGQGSEFFTGINSSAEPNSIGAAGEVLINAAETLEIFNGGWISSDTSATGDAGTVTVNATRLTIDGQGTGAFTGISSDAAEESTGAAGKVQVSVTELLEIFNGGVIVSDTSAVGNAGMVTVDATRLKIDGQGSVYLTGIFSNANPNSTGAAGKVQVSATETLEILKGGVIASATSAVGNANSVTVNAPTLLIDDQSTTLFTGITTQAVDGSSGNAGTIRVFTTDNLTITGGEINSDTFSQGTAGSVFVTANNLLVNGPGGIASTASDDSSGKVGDVFISAQNLRLTNGGGVSIENFADVAAGSDTDDRFTQININARKLELTNGSQITAESTGAIPASDIFINASKRLLVNNAQITTEAAEADGGGISITGGSVVLRGGQITTSVAGLSGDGGNITLTPDSLALDTGFIQANTLAEGGSGGNIVVNTPALLVNGGLDNVRIGDPAPLTFLPGLNAIQAAAPEGFSGDIQVTPPNFDINAALTPLPSMFLDLSKLAEDPCAVQAGVRPSSLTPVGRGGLPADATDASAPFLGGEQLHKLLTEPATKPNSAKRQDNSGLDLPILPKSSRLWPITAFTIACKRI